MADVINFVDRALAPEPDLIVHASDLPATAEALRDLLAASGRLFDRGTPQPAKFDPQGDRKPSFEKWAEWRSPNAAATTVRLS
jgi:hypothetical protein